MCVTFHGGAYARLFKTSRRFAIYVAGVAALSWPAAVSAKDETIEPEPTRAAPADAPSKFDFAYGVSLTTDYVSRGITQTGSDPAIQGYIEPTYGDFYVNIWSSNVDFGTGFDGAEIDALQRGIDPRSETSPSTVGSTISTPQRHLKPGPWRDLREGDYNLNDKITFAGRMFLPDFNQSGKTATFIAGGAKRCPLHDFATYGGIGYQFFEDDNVCA